MNIPYGFCECGCGQKTEVTPWSDRNRGFVKGEPKRFVRGHNGRKALTDRYRVSESGCWLWLGDMNNQGYGQIAEVEGGQRRMMLAHRWVYEQVVDPIPEELVLDHLCRTRLCVNPKHLEPVSHAENCRRGSRAKLTAAQVAEIKATPEIKPSEWAARLGVKACTISNIRAGRAWADIDPAEYGFIFTGRYWVREAQVAA
jgi:hypothetical protein